MHERGEELLWRCIRVHHIRLKNRDKQPCNIRGHLYTRTPCRPFLHITLLHEHDFDSREVLPYCQNLQTENPRKRLEGLPPFLMVLTFSSFGQVVNINIFKLNITALCFTHSLRDG